MSPFRYLFAFLIFLLPLILPAQIDTFSIGKKQFVSVAPEGWKLLLTKDSMRMPGGANLIYSHPVRTKEAYSYISCGVEWNADRFTANRIKNYRKHSDDKEMNVTVEDVYFSDMRGLLYCNLKSSKKYLNSIYYFVYRINDSADLVIVNNHQVNALTDRSDMKIIFLNYCDDFIAKNKTVLDSWNPRLGIPGSSDTARIGNDTLNFLIPDGWRVMQKNTLSNASNLSGKSFTLIRNKDLSCQPATISYNVYDRHAGSNMPNTYLHYDYNRGNYVFVDTYKTIAEAQELSDTIVNGVEVKTKTGATIEKINTCPLPYLAYERYYTVRISDNGRDLLMVLYLRCSCTDTFDLKYWDEYFDTYIAAFMKSNDFLNW